MPFSSVPSSDGSVENSGKTRDSKLKYYRAVYQWCLLECTVLTYVPNREAPGLLPWPFTY